MNLPMHNNFIMNKVSSMDLENTELSSLARSTPSYDWPPAGLDCFLF